MQAWSGTSKISYCYGQWEQWLICHKPTSCQSILIFICIRSTQQQHIFILLFLIRYFSYENETGLNPVLYPKVKYWLHVNLVFISTVVFVRLENINVYTSLSGQKLSHTNHHLPKGLVLTKTNKYAHKYVLSLRDRFFFFNWWLI